MAKQDSRPRLMLTAREWEEAELYGTLPFTAAGPDFSMLDDSDATLDKQGLTLRDRKLREYQEKIDAHLR